MISRKRKVLLIGGTGTISTAVTQRIAKSEDWEVYILNRGQRKADIPENVKVIKCDIIVLLQTLIFARDYFGNSFYCIIELLW